MKAFLIGWALFVVAGMSGFLFGKDAAEVVPKTCGWCQPNQPMYGAKE